MYPVATQKPVSLISKYDSAANLSLIPMAQYPGHYQAVVGQQQPPHLTVAVPPANVDYGGRPGSSQGVPASPLYQDNSLNSSPIRPGHQQAVDQANAQHLMMHQRQQQMDMMRQRSIGAGQQQQGGMMQQRPSLNTMQQGHPQLMSATPSPQQPSAFNPNNRRASSPAAVYTPNPIAYSNAYARPVQALQHHSSDFAVYQQQQQYIQQQRMGEPSGGAPRPYGMIPAQHGWSSQPGFPSGVRMGMPGLPPHVIRNPGPRPDELDEGDDEYSGMIYDPYQVKHRKRTTPEQLAVLEQAFEENNKPSAMARKQMADQIGMTARSVQVWFQNRRQKRKAVEKKRIEEEVQMMSEGMVPSGPPGGPMHGQKYLPNGMMVPMQQTPSGTTGSSSDNSPDITPNQPPMWTSMAPPPLAGQIGLQPNFAVPGQPQDRLVHKAMSTDNVRSPVGASPQQSIGAAKGVPMISQARRGSLPYPPPNLASAMASGQNPRTVSAPNGVPMAKSNIPLHVAISINNGRRASLPGNSRSMSTGPFTPPRNGQGPIQGMPVMQGAGRELNAIQDHEEQGPSDLGYLDTNAGSAEQQHALAASGGAPSMATAMLGGEGSGQNMAPGPLPQPGFSFGNPNLDMSGQQEYADQGNFTTLQDNVSPLSSMSSGISPMDAGNPNFAFYVPRGRMGSMASILSVGTTATDPDSLSDWERQMGGPFMYQQYPGQMGPPMIATDIEKDKMNFPPGLAGLTPSTPWAPSLGDRRASAPPDLLQKFETLDVDHSQTGLTPLQGHRRSPLNSSFVAPDGTAGDESKGKVLTPGGLSVIKADETSDAGSNETRTPDDGQRLPPSSPFSDHTHVPFAAMGNGPNMGSGFGYSFGGEPPHQGLEFTEGHGEFQFGVDEFGVDPLIGHEGQWTTMSEPSGSHSQQHDHQQGSVLEHGTAQQDPR